MATPAGNALSSAGKPLDDWFDQTGRTIHDADACFKAFDRNWDGLLDLAEFSSVLQALFHDEIGKAYALKPEKISEIFAVFDKNKDKFVDKKEFEHCWNNWIKKIIWPVSVFVIVDVQNDFISGSLDISTFPDGQRGIEVIAPINNLLATVAFDGVFYSIDWHPDNHISFIDNLKLRPLDTTSKVSAEEAKVFDTVVFKGPPLVQQQLWPQHCVQDSWGAQLHDDLMVAENAFKVYKGTNPEIDSYSAFYDNNKLSETVLRSQIEHRNATDIYVCGLAYDVCVGSTAADALALGYRTILIDDCSRGVKLNDIERTKDSFTRNGGVIVPSSRVKSMVAGRDRRPELGYKLALELNSSDN